jgi:hypothetical protein
VVPTTTVTATPSPLVAPDVVPPTPPDEPFTLQTVSLPPGIAEVGQFDVADDGSLVFTYRPGAGSPQQVGRILPDGTGFTCLSCGSRLADVAVGNPVALDAQRVFVQSPPNNRVADSFEYLVLECLPSLADCATSTVKPVTGLVTGTSDAVGIQDRYFRASSDGSHLVWSRIRPDGYHMLLADLVDEGANYDLVDTRVINPVGYDIDGDATARQLATPWYEAKDISRDGRYVAFSSSLAGSLNYDNFLLDLTNGQVSRLSDDPDWDENVFLDPAGETFIAGTSAGQDRQAAWGNVPRPPFIDAALVGPLSNFFLPRILPGVPDPGPNGGVVRRLLELPGQRSGYLGQEFDQPGDGMWRWSGDGTRIFSLREVPDPASRGQVAVLQAITFTDREPVVPVEAPPVDPTWAPNLADRPVRADVTGTATVDGPAGGTATIERSGTILFGSWSVTYDHYSQDGCSFLDGTQSTTTEGIKATYTEATTVTGCHTGFTNGDVAFNGVASTGTISSSYDGRSFARTLPFRVGAS